MIKKPKPLTMPDLLRLKQGEEQSAIIKRNNEVTKYENFIFDELVKEFSPSSIAELLFLVVEKYHPRLKIKEAKGAKKKWDDYLCSMVAVEIDARRNSKNTLKKVINDLCKHPTWGRFVENIYGGGEEQFKKVYKIGKKAKLYNYAKYIRSTPGQWDEHLNSELDRFLKPKRKISQD